MVHGDLVRPTPSRLKEVPTGSADQKDREREKSTPQEATSVHLGRYVFVSQGCTLHPPSRLTSTNVTPAGSNEQSSTTSATLTYYPLRISDHVYIGPNTVVRAAEIRSNVHIGANCVIGNMALIKDNIRILEGSVIPANSVWASGSVIAGAPARVVGEVGEGWGGGTGGSAGGVGAASEEGAGVRSRERWASVGNKR